VATYVERHTVGTVEAANPRGIKLRGLWRNTSSFAEIDLAPFAIGDVVSIHAAETPNGSRRFINAIERASARDLDDHIAALVDEIPDLAEPDEPAAPEPLPDSPAPLDPSVNGSAPRHLVADRLACLDLATKILTPWWVKKGEEPDTALVIGAAEAFLAYLHHHG
jgi:hypothetical protein